MKKLFFAMMIVVGTVAFSACENKTTNTDADESVVDRDTTIETTTDTTITETVVETDTVTRTVDGGESKDTVKKQ